MQKLKFIPMAATLLFAATVSAQTSPAGLWRTIDDETKQPKSLVRITENAGVFSGRVEKILTEKTDAVCDKCTDSRKDKPVLGMTLIDGIRAEGKDFSGGTILDPNNGKTYRARLTPRDGGAKLEVRGYIGTPLLGRSQVWERVE